MLETTSFPLMARRMLLTPVTTPAVQAPAFARAPEMMPGQQTYLQKLDKLEAKYSPKRKTKKSKRKRRVKKKTHRASKKVKVWYRQMKRSKKGKSTGMGIALTNRTMLRRIVNKLPSGNKPLSELMGVEGWLDRRTTMSSLMRRIPQSKQTLFSTCGIKGCS